MMKLDLIVPFLNEEKSLPDLIARMDSVADQASTEFDLDVGYIFVDDGSTDQGFATLMSHDFGNRRVCLRQLSRNFGKEAALSAGIEAAKAADLVVMMDADLQHPPETILEFLSIWREQNADSVYAYKADRKADEGWAKNLLSRMFYWTINRTNRYHIPENAGDFRLMNRDFMNALMALPEAERFMKGLYGWVGMTQVGVPFSAMQRDHGTSKFRLRNMLLMTIDALTSFSVAPLRLMAVSGFLIAALSAIYGVYIMLERIFVAQSGIGIASVLVLVSFFGGVQMLFLGILGEYVGKAMLEAKRRPSYIVKRDVRQGDGADNE